MKSYVTFSQDGSLTGGFLQEPAAEHTNIVEVSAEVRMNWPMYRANESRDGVEMLPPVPLPIYIPHSITRRQAKQIMVASGLSLAAIDAMIDALAEPEQTFTRIFWEDSNDFERANPVLNQMAASLGLSAAQIDQMFIAGALL